MLSKPFWLLLVSRWCVVWVYFCCKLSVARPFTSSVYVQVNFYRTPGCVPGKSKHRRKLWASSLYLSLASVVCVFRFGWPSGDYALLFVVLLRNLIRKGCPGIDYYLCSLRLYYCSGLINGFPIESTASFSSRRIENYLSHKVQPE